MRAKPLSPAAYRPYGTVIAAAGGKPIPANMGTARRWDFLAELVNKRPGKAKANLCVFRCAPFKGKRFTAKLLERHAHSTQVFLPLSSSRRALVIVAKGGRKPDLSTLAAFIMEGPRGISYRPGIWHHPMIALGTRADMACFVHEDGSRQDCEVFPLPAPVTITV
ncbi:MAG: ureidoglycolate lyase [Elusimicrobia bacterium]|nr:ureidoglycolate lyase [Elusimicrobiota bacterium]